MVSSTNQIKEKQEKSFLYQAIQEALNQGFPFSLWKTPDQHEKHLIICQRGLTYVDEVTLEESTSGFVFAPFLPEQKKIIFPADVLYRFENGVLKEATNHDDSNFNQSQFQNLLPFNIRESENINTVDFKDLVALSVKQIEADEFEKIVPSRVKDISIDNKFDLLNAFELLCEKHPNALVSLVSSLETGTWMGATPELLVSVTGNKFKTVALAGTLPYSPDLNLKSVAWTQKEIEEQALVCRYIINCFKKIRLREYEEHGPKTIVAGNVMHLKTDYEVDMQATNFPQLGSVMLKLLHPTSAVCGMPLESTLSFLKKNEGYDRQFYSGYLGPVNIKKESHVFVNLRCMQLFSEKIRLYAGAGITADSVAEMEWRETEMKMSNLQKIINQY
ncbi:MAG: chorismate-binding protein [Cyclobacteriaceae bacterium]|nr:chorismate-binding protein [Cyclobacteriaceae bacterium]